MSGKRERLKANTRYKSECIVRAGEEVGVGTKYTDYGSQMKVRDDVRIIKITLSPFHHSGERKENLELLIIMRVYILAVAAVKAGDSTRSFQLECLSVYLYQ